MTKSTYKPTPETLAKKAEYDKANTKGLYIKLNKNTDADIIEYLNGIGNKQGLIKSLIRSEIRKDKLIARREKI